MMQGLRTFITSDVIRVYQAESDEAARQACLIPAMPVREQAILQRISVAPP